MTDAELMATILTPTCSDTIKVFHGNRQKIWLMRFGILKTHRHWGQKFLDVKVFIIMNSFQANGHNISS